MLMHHHVEYSARFSDELGNPTYTESRGIYTAFTPSTFKQENLGIARLSQLRSTLSALLKYVHLMNGGRFNSMNLTVTRNNCPQVGVCLEVEACLYQPFV